MNTYQPEECAVFCKTKEMYGGLSNMASGFPLVLSAIEIRTTEALYQACRFPHLPEIQQEIFAQKSPMAAKMKSKPHRDLSREDWRCVRKKIMDWCLHLKLAQHWKTFGELLLSTGSRPIVELSKKDDYWGAKMRRDGLLVGENVLGELLMALREKRRAFADESSLTLPHIEGIVLLGKHF